MAFYPTLREETVAVLNTILQQIDKDPGYLSSPECPYSDLAKQVLGKFKSSAEVVDIFEGKDEVLVIDQQIHAIINDLESVGSTLGSADQAEKLNYFKVKTTLLEKLINMRERTFNLKELNEFRSTILAFLDEVCTKDQITDLMKRLDGVLGTSE